MGIERGRRRDLILICVGGGVTWFGNALALISLMLVLRPAGGFALAGLFLADSVPLFVIAPLAGLLVDRLPNRKLMIAAQLGQGAAALGLALSLSNLPLVFAFVALLSTGNAIARPASSALVPAVVGEDNATRGYSWISTASSTGMLLGTAAGGVLVAGLGAHDALLIDALTYAAQAATLLLVRADRRPERHPDRPGAGKEVLAGLKFLASDRVLIVGIGATSALSFAGTMVNVAEVFFVTVVLHGSAAILGLLQATWMVGMLTGARLAARVTTARGIALLMACCGCLPGVAFAVPAAFPLVALLAASYLIGGLGNGIQNVCESALIRSRTPQEMRGRVFSGAGTAINVTGTIGNVLSGLLVTVIGARGCFASAAAICLLTGLTALTANRRITVPEQEQRTARTI
ncbi:MAG TPA: MFS transporter [Pseudonocardiaceae bacterium]